MLVNSTVSATDSPLFIAFCTLTRFSASKPLGRPMCLPWAAANCWPARVFSRMLSRSYSASEAKMESMSLPAGVVVSMPRSRALKWTPRWWKEWTR